MLKSMADTAVSIEGKSELQELNNYIILRLTIFNLFIGKFDSSEVT